jgi:hypothetical protein
VTGVSKGSFRTALAIVLGSLLVIGGTGKLLFVDD